MRQAISANMRPRLKSIRVPRGQSSNATGVNDGNRDTGHERKGQQKSSDDLPANGARRIRDAMHLPSRCPAKPVEVGIASHLAALCDKTPNCQDQPGIRGAGNDDQNIAASNLQSIRPPQLRISCVKCAVIVLPGQSGHSYCFGYQGNLHHTQ